jgi:hypothetical protein
MYFPLVKRGRIIDYRQDVSYVRKLADKEFILLEIGGSV